MGFPEGSNRKAPKGWRKSLEGLFIIGTVKSFMKNGKAYGTTEDTEKDSVSSRKKIKRQRLAGWEIDSLVEGEAVLGDRGIHPYEGTEGRE
jgi:hypothetical protein